MTHVSFSQLRVYDCNNSQIYTEADLFGFVSEFSEVVFVLFSVPSSAVQPVLGPA